MKNVFASKSHFLFLSLLLLASAIRYQLYFVGKYGEF